MTHNTSSCVSPTMNTNTSSTSSTECNICCKTVKHRNIITCFKCQFEVCSKCVEHYILDRVDVKCMNCNFVFNYNELTMILSPTFLGNEFRDHRRNCLFDMEKAQFPEMSRVFEKEIEVQKYRDDKHAAWERKNKAEYNCQVYRDQKNDIEAVIKSLLESINEPKLTPHRISRLYHMYFSHHDREPNDVELPRSYKNMALVKSTMVNYVNEVRATNFETRQRLIQLRDEARHEYEAYHNHIPWLNIYNNQSYVQFMAFDTTNTATVRDKKEIHRTMIKCPIQDCHAFVSPMAMPYLSCSACNKLSCKMCLELFEKDGHVCNEELVQTIAMIKKESTGCPKCGVRVTKIEGCNTMFCTNCNSHFCYRTGEVITRGLHNPHYTEYLLRTKGMQTPQPVRNIVENPCNTNLQGAWKASYENILYKNIKFLSYAFFHLLSTENDELTKVLYSEATYDSQRRGMRYEFLKSKMNEEQYKCKLLTCEKKYYKSQELYNICKTQETVLIDLFHYYDETKNEEALIEGMKNIIAFTLQSLNKVEKLYKMTVRYPKFFMTTRCECWIKLTSEFRDSNAFELMDEYVRSRCAE